MVSGEEYGEWRERHEEEREEEHIEGQDEEQDKNKMKSMMKCTMKEQSEEKKSKGLPQKSYLENSAPTCEFRSLLATSIGLFQ
ncbi:hypothetical protein GC098_07120 [Paenibacillus sp. LMG 31458]|uniref:Uncharacterized protein n=1 Tax=Paenibacillus phytorum TaxID=2654977 RepID=A0ABX1XSE2_9BACL|nr:hypothetical protein [Paenibacillus phytorum]NOU71199.1 hypothetical protein [Paenibacillus phytorum]